MRKRYSRFDISQFADIIEEQSQKPRYGGKRRWWEKHDMPFDPIRPLWKRIFNVF
ncbi:MAG: hypothetical protein LBT80_07500 [Lactobacillaceae bacterium]|jgi:hypothetical protein|nr:hypothetical protein [Lactobacillaceae bacterium]